MLHLMTRMRGTFVSLLIAGSLSASATCMSAAEFPNNERRILYYEDHGIEWSFMRRTSDPDEMKAALEEGIDALAAAGVDTVSVVSFVRFFTNMGGSTVVPEPSPFEPSYQKLAEGGHDPTQVWIDRCHHHGMEYIPTLRMNDRHSASYPYGQFIHEHPEWHLKGVNDSPPGMDYTHEPVRQKILAFIEELLASYDVDGLEFDWMRWCHMFTPGEGAQKAHLLTDFTRKARQTLDAAAQRRGRSRLPLGVRVPQTLEECDYLGFDLAGWIQEGLVDYVVPGDFLNLDTNIKVEKYVKLTEGTNCKVYPALFPWPSYRDRVRVASLAQYRAAAQNFYAHGADGVQFYNFQVHWQRRYDDAPAPGRWLTFAWMWPKALDYFREVRDPQTISQGDRHYLFYRLWPQMAPTHGVKDERIVLDRTEPAAQDSQHFRVSEDLSDPKLQATLLFKAVDMTQDESLELWLNGTRVPQKQITRRFQKKGQNESQGVELAPYYLYIIDVPRAVREPLIINGDNELTVRLIPTEAQGKSLTSFRFVDMVLGVQADDANGVSNVDLNGCLDDYAIWSRTLSDSEIRGIYDRGQRGIGIKTSEPSSPAAAQLEGDLRVLYEFDSDVDLGVNSAAGGRPAQQVGPGGTAVSMDAKAPKIGRGAADFTSNDATLKVDATDVGFLMPGPGGLMTVSYWLKSSSQSANHTVWSMSNLPIPSPLYSTNRAVAMFATQTITVAEPQQVALGMVRPGATANTQSQVNVTDGKWHHIAVTINQDAETAGVTAQLFIDGQAIDDELTIAGSPAADSTSGTVSIEELECYVYVRK